MCQIRTTAVYYDTTGLRSLAHWYVLLLLVTAVVHFGTWYVYVYVLLLFSSILFLFVELNGGSAKAVAMTKLLSCLFCSFCRVSFFCSLVFPFPPALCRFLPRLRVSSVQPLSVPLQHVLGRLLCIFFKVQKWPLFAPSVCDVIF